MVIQGGLYYRYDKEAGLPSSTKIDFIYLSEQDMIKAGVDDMPACVEAMDEMFKLLHIGDYRMPGANNNSHGAMIQFPESSPHPTCLLYTSPSPRDQRGSRMPSSA